MDTSTACLPLSPRAPHAVVRRIAFQDVYSHQHHLPYLYTIAACAMFFSSLYPVFNATDAAQRTSPVDSF
jgi:hypothetical protein